MSQATKSKCTDRQMLLFFMLHTSEHCIYRVAFWTWGVMPIHCWPFSCSWVLVHERSASRYPVHLTSRSLLLLGALKCGVTRLRGYEVSTCTPNTFHFKLISCFYLCKCNMHCSVIYHPVHYESCRPSSTEAVLEPAEWPSSTIPQCAGSKCKD